MSIKNKFGLVPEWDIRKKRLQKELSFNLSPLEKVDYDFLNTFNFKSKQLGMGEMKELLRIYNKTLNVNNKPSTCRDCWINIIRVLEFIYKDYKNNK